MSEEIKVLGKCEGYEWGLDCINRFTPVETGNCYDTYAKMEEALERLNKSKAKVEKKKLAIDAIYEESGESVVITGIHSGHGGVITKPKVDTNYGGMLLPKSEWIAKAIKERKTLTEKRDAIDAVLESFNIISRGWRAFTPDHYATELESLEKRAAKQQSRADKTTLEAELKQYVPAKIEFD